MSLALIVCLVGGLLYLVCAISSRYTEAGELGRLAFLAGLVAFLFGR